MKPFAEIIADLNADPRVIVLVGPPASGKSTWRQSYQASTARPAIVVSTDDLIDRYAAHNGMTYTEAFGKLKMEDLDATAIATMRAALAAGQDVIIDRTNLRIKGRARFLSQVPKRYLRVAIVFNVPRDVLDQRLADRAAATGKFIPKQVVDDMVKGYEYPTTDEFDLIEILS